MGTGTIPITPATDRSPTRVFRKLEAGDLKGITVRLVSGSPRHGETYVKVGLTRAKDNIENIYQVFVSDYITLTYNPYWTGSFPLEREDFLFVEARSSVAVSMDAVAVVDRPDLPRRFPRSKESV